MARHSSYQWFDEQDAEVVENSHRTKTQAFKSVGANDTWGDTRLGNLDVAAVNLSNKMNGYIRRLRHEIAMWQYHRNQTRCDRLFNDWVNRLSRNSPDVLIGANFAEYGGVRGHLQAVKKHSRLRVEMAPPDWLLSAIGFYESQCRMRKDFSRFDASKLTAIHSHVFPLYTDWCLSQKLQRGVFWVHTYHLNYYPEHCRGVMEEWKQQINQSLLTTAKHADVRISVSEWQRKELSDSHDIETIYIPNGVDVDLCLKASADRFRRRQKLDQFVLYVGRNDPVKNPEEFVELARHIPGVCCVMIGGDLSYDSMAELCGPLPKNIRILGSQPSAVVNDALAAASAVVVPSKREGLPTLVLEAMVHETPLIVADEPGCLEAVQQGEFALVYRLGDVSNLARLVIRTMELRQRNEGALKLVHEKYSWRVVAPQLDEVYLRSRP